MVARLSFFLDADDELALFRELATLGLHLYPRICDRAFRPLPVAPAAVTELDALGDGEDFYLAVPECGEIPVRDIKRGPNKGGVEIDEVNGAVIFYRRSRFDEDGLLRSGEIWAELEVGGDLRRVGGKPVFFKKRLDEVLAKIKRRAVQSDPPAHWIGVSAAQRVKRGNLVLRESGRKGALVHVRG